MSYFELEELLKDVEVREVRGSVEGLRVSGIEEDSRKVREGVLFVAKRGVFSDGHEFLKEAERRGAAAAVVERFDASLKIPQVRVKDSRRALARMAARFFGSPQERLVLISVTGTNGKSSFCWFVKEALRKAGVKCGLVGTLLYDTGKRTVKARETTPPPLTLYRLLSEMTESGVTHAVMEVSSHALDQERVEGLRFRVGAFTNLSHDHLDYHGTLENYFETKLKLFRNHLEENATVVAHADDPWGKKVLSTTGKTIRIGEDLKGRILERNEGLVVEVSDGSEVFVVKTALFGDFQLRNLLLAWGALRALGMSAKEVAASLEGVRAPRGRFEFVGEFKGAKFFVDYAHTPEALRHLLESARKMCSGRLVCVFGCGGNRDREKRPLMGKIASRLADVLVVTSDNPRDEDPEAIIRDILEGVEGNGVVVEPERARALKKAVELVSSGDVVVVAGKGHETYQEVMGRRIPFSDQEELRRLFSGVS